ncbi:MULTISPECIES: CBS domain-containing protein [Amycolatopsis]|uniref:CBS domain-containing protein n=1 Tax=Amycolatopsis dendrobii TaxID=2760662 RepID=A0A7W3VWP1_9PSEU|nr:MULTISPECIES: CBS domain-containing protein [Amycolatopsis]MBB1154490.1 CBS domain-containing protein [Amycolatopsis dendrobii]UKD56695.1 CBS domain-containing protein [Amycolatopsis sp. FU40]
MRARDLMSSPAETVRPWTSADEAAGILAERGFPALPVVDDEGRLVGIVTEAELGRGRTPARGRDRRPCRPGAIETTVGAVMTSPAAGMPPGADLADVCRELVDSKSQAMPIVVQGRRVVGIVTRGDVVRVLARADTAIAADVRHRLEVYGGTGRWKVEVHEGIVRITDRYDEEADRDVATLLALAVPGVVAADPAGEGPGR